MKKWTEKKLLIMFLMFSSIGWAQFKQKSIYPVYVNYPDYTVKADVFAEPKKISVNENLIYYWYYSNKIMETKGGYDGKVLNGSYTSYYLSKNLKEKGTFRNGLKNGGWTMWNNDGSLNEISTWKNGSKNGTYKKFNSAGELAEESQYKNGLLNGYKKEYTKGELTTKTQYKKGVVVIPKVKAAKEKPSSEPKRKSLFKKKEKKEVQPSAGQSLEKDHADTGKKSKKSLFRKKTKEQKDPLPEK